MALFGIQSSPPAAPRFRAAGSSLLLFLGVMAGWAGLGWSEAHGQSPRRILNQASGEYIDPRTAQVIPLLSNIVEVQLSASPGILLEADRHLQGTPGAPVVLQHLLTNPGGVTGRYVISAQVANGSDYALEDGQIWWDANNNGRPDSTETFLAAITGTVSARVSQVAPATLSLAPGESATLLLTGRIPATAQPGLQALIDLRAFEPQANLSAANRDTITVSLDPVNLRKSVSPAVAKRLQEVTWRLDFNTVGTLPVMPVTIDGAIVKRILLRDTIPPNTTFARFLFSHIGQPLYHSFGAPYHDYQTMPPADLGQVDAIAWAFPSLTPGLLYDVSFVTTVNGNASGRIPNLALLHFGEGLTVKSLTSNLVETVVPLSPPVIRYFTNQKFERIAPFTRLGRDLYVQADASACNFDPLQAEQVNITIQSTKTGDMETFLGTETGPNTGVFRILPAVPTADASRAAVMPSNGTLESVVNDILVASIRECGGSLTVTTIVVDPRGVVFDSRTNVPVAGARVTLIDVTGQGNGGRPGQPARVYEEDFETAASSTFTTGPDGVFIFPLTEASTYRIAIEPPAGYVFPSLVPRGLLDAGRLIRTPDSYGGTFRLEDEWNPLSLDLPLDPNTSDGILLTKEVSRNRAEVGDSVIYALTLKNTTGADLRTTSIDDHLPHGFEYERGSAFLNGQPAPDPAGGAGPHLNFTLGTVADGATAVVTYRVRLGPGSVKGTGINRARAISLGPPILFSNEARAQVTVEPGLLQEEGVIFGRVFVDCDADEDRLPGPDDLGVPGVRVYLENGTYAITDEEGKYSIYGQRPLTHVVKVDPFTLPAGARLKTIDSRNAGDPDFRFADLKKGELHKANFAVCPDPAVIEDVKNRRAKAAFSPEYQTALKRDLTSDGRTPPVTDPRGAPSSGIIGSNNGQNEAYTPLLPPRTLTAGNSNLPAAPLALLPEVNLEAIVQKETDPTPIFLDLRDGDTVPLAIVDVRLKGASGSVFTLRINDQEISPKRVGKSVDNMATGVRLVQYVGLKLQPGQNRLEFTQFDMYGNARGGQAVSVFAPDSLSRLQVSFAPADPVADGGTPLQVQVRLEDEAGRLVTARTPLTLETDYGRWEPEDVNPAEPGTQVFLSGGTGTYDLIPSVNPGEAHLAISSGRMVAERKVRFQAQMRPFVVAGVAEGRLDFMGGDTPPGEGGFSNESTAASPFEDVVSQLGTWDEEQAMVNGRVSAFAKGEISKGWLLTASYDSAKEEHGKLFRDIDPDTYYPVFGDSSIRGFDAQSTSNLFARLENRNNYLQWGDFTTQETGQFSLREARQLSSYNRSLTGLSGHYEDDRAEVNAWASYTRARRVVVEIPANGTSGPFRVAPLGDGLRNSELIEIVTRDRNQPSLILTTETLARFTDYDFEPFSGRLLLRRPVPSFDSSFNPQSIRITYELEAENGDPSWVWGADAQYRILPWWEMGASYVQDDNPYELYTLTGVNSTFQLGEGTYLITEVARSDDLVEGEGWGQRAELRHESAKTEARLYATHTDDSFKNSSAMAGSGRIEGGLEGTYHLTDSTQIHSEGIYSEDVASSGNRRGIRADVAHTLPNKITVEVGGRLSKETATPAGPVTRTVEQTGPDATATPNTVRSLRLRVGTPVPRLEAASVYGEWENDVVETDRRILALGGDYQVKAKTRLYARHEFIDSLGGDFQINSIQQNNRTLVGVESEYMRGGNLFNEYRVRDAIDGRSAEAATGLRNEWDLDAGWMAHTSLERVSPFDGKKESESTSLTTGLEYTENKDWKATTRFEVRLSPNTDSFLHTLGYARKIDPRWTFLARTIYYQIDSSAPDAPAAAVPPSQTSSLGFGSFGTADLRQVRLLTGFAYRPIDNDTWNALFRYEFKYEDGSLDFHDDLERVANIFSVGWNWQPARSFILSGRYAIKHVQEYRLSGDSRYTGQLLGARALLDLTRRLDAGLSGSVYFNDSFESFEYALGPEVGVNFKKDMRLAVGWNFFGYEDRDFSDLVYSREGLFISLRVKFDENFLRDLWGSDDEDDSGGKCHE